MQQYINVGTKIFRPYIYCLIIAPNSVLRARMN
jgi:hypothetical protein